MEHKHDKVDPNNPLMHSGELSEGIIIENSSYSGKDDQESFEQSDISSESHHFYEENEPIEFYEEQYKEHSEMITKIQRAFRKMTLRNSLKMYFMTAFRKSKLINRTHKKINYLNIRVDNEIGMYCIVTFTFLIKLKAIKVTLKNMSSTLKNREITIHLLPFVSEYSSEEAMLAIDNLRDITRRMLDEIFVEDSTIKFKRNLIDIVGGHYYEWN